MSILSVRGEQSTSSEINTLTNLGSLPTSGALEFIRKTGTTTFENATVGESIALSELNDVVITSPISGQILSYNGSEWENSATTGIGDMVLANIQSVTGLKTFDKDKIAMKGTSTGVTTISTANTSGTSYTAILQAGNGTIAYLTDIPAGAGTVTSVSVTTANGISGSVATETTTPAITLTLGAITPTTVNGNTLTTGTGTITITGTKTLTVADTASVSGTNTGDNVAASTSVAGLAPQATAPAAGLYNYLGITNGETAYTNKALFNATNPSTQAFGDSAVVGTSANAARQDHKHAMMAAPTSVSGNAGTVTTAAETGDTSCSIAFVTTTSGSLPLKTNTNLTFNASTGVLTSASAVLTTADINGGTIDNATIGASTASTIIGTTITANTGLMPDANDGAYIGQAGTAFSDLFLAEGGVINWDSGDVTLTQTENVVVLAGATLETSTVGTAANSVVTIDGAQTLTAKNITLGINNRIALTLPTTDGNCSGHTTASFVAGETVALGNVVFFKSDGKWWLTDSDAVVTCKGLIGIALTAGNANDAITVALPNSFIHVDAWTWTAGDTLYVGDATAGTLQNAIPTGADCIIKVAGFAIDADTIYFAPSSDQQSTIA